MGVGRWQLSGWSAGSKISTVEPLRSFLLMIRTKYLQIVTCCIHASLSTIAPFPSRQHSIFLRSLSSECAEQISCKLVVGSIYEGSVSTLHPTSSGFHSPFSSHFKLPCSLARTPYLYPGALHSASPLSVFGLFRPASMVTMRGPWLDKTVENIARLLT